MVSWTAEKDQTVSAHPTLFHRTATNSASQLVKGIFAFCDIKNSAPLLKYLAAEIGEGTYLFKPHQLPANILSTKIAPPKPCPIV
jgi:hypothetical protein